MVGVCCDYVVGGWWVVQTADMVLCNVSLSCRESEDKCNGNIMRAVSDIYYNK